MHTGKLKKWEIALALSLLLTWAWGLLFGEPSCAAWWGVMYPELTAADSAAAFSPDAVSGGVTVRFALWDWLKALLCP